MNDRYASIASATMQIDEDIMVDSLNVLSLYTNQRRHIVQCNDMQERAITNGLICYQSTDKHFPIHATISDR